MTDVPAALRRTSDAIQALDAAEFRVREVKEQIRALKGELEIAEQDRTAAEVRLEEIMENDRIYLSTPKG